MKNTLLQSLIDSPMKNTRLLIALSSLTWAVLLFWSGDLFEASRKTYAIMAQIASEPVWATLFLLHGILAFWTLKTSANNKLSLWGDAFLGCILWTTSTFACFIAHWPNGDFLTAFATYNPPAAMSGELWVAIFSWWSFVRHWADSGKEP